MALILETIQPQAFEIIRDRIAAILKDEINRQALLTYDAILNVLNISIEGINPEDKTELAKINVCLSNGNYEAKDYGSAARANPYQYNIDVYTNAKTTPSIDGDYSAAKTAQKILGLCRYILEHSIYKTLGFIPGFIERVYCNDINIRDESKNDALNSYMGRLTFNVVAIENCQLVIPQLLQGYQTTATLGNTNEGYLYAGT